MRVACYEVSWLTGNAIAFIPDMVVLIQHMIHFKLIVQSEIIPFCYSAFTHEGQSRVKICRHFHKLLV